MTPRRLLVPLLAVATALVVAAPVASVGSSVPAVAGAKGIGDHYFPEDGNGGYDALRYAVHDSYRFSDGRLSGSTTVILRTTERLSSFDLDFLLPVSKVTLSTGRATFRRPDRHELRIIPARPIPAGTRLTATVTYAGHPGDLSWGGESNWVADAHEVAAINEPHMAAWWFPSNDHPLDKAVMDLHITVPKGNQVVAGGRLESVRRAGGHTTYHWHGGPMTTYLAFFVAGHLAVRSGTSHGLPYYNVVSQQLSPAARHAAFQGLARTPGIVRWIASRVGRYPWSQTGGVVTSLDPGFSLETQTRPTYPRSVFTSLMVHELSHQWFGDSVSVRRWRDIWLNEGFATFMEQWYAQGHGGPTTRAWLHRTYDSFPADWAVTVADPGPRRIFDYAVYERGGMTLAALRQRIGNADFIQVMRSWFRSHRGGHGTTAQFEALAEQVSGQDLASFFDAWLVQPVKPAATAANGL